MEEMKVEQVRLKDGRYAEIKTHEQKDGDTGQGEVVYEHYEEEPRQLHLRKRVTEKRKPIIYERVIESIDGNEVVEKRVESCDPQVQMQLREHIGLAKAQAQEVDPCYATCGDLKEAMLAVAEAVRENAQPLQQRGRMQAVVEEEVQKTDAWGVVEWILLGIISVEGAWLAIHIIPRFFAA